MSILLNQSLQRGHGWSDNDVMNQISSLLNHLQSADNSLKIFRRGYEIVFQNTAQPRSAFDVKIDPNDRTKVIVGSQRSQASYRLDDHVQVGTAAAAVTAPESIAITEDSYVYYEFPDSGTPTPILKIKTVAAGYPTPAGSNIIAVLCRADWDSTASSGYPAGSISKVTPYRYGQITSSPGTPATAASYLVKITGHATGTTYNCDIYGNGSGAASTGSGSVIIAQVVSGDAVPVGTWVNAILIGVTYYGQVPVWQDVGGAGAAPSAGLSGLVETTDATATTLLAHTISDTNTAVLITANIVAYSTGNDRGGWVISGTFYRDAAGALQESTTTTQHSKASGYSAAFDVSGNDVRVRITGAAGETVKWKGFATAYEVT